MTVTLKALHLAKSYKGRQVVRDVSVSIDSGQIVGLLGPNGAGKTTCFYMIVGLVKAEQGSRADRRPGRHRPAMHGRARAGIGYLPQEASIFRKLTVADNILGILETRKDLNKAGRLRELESLLQEFHITHIRDNRGYEPVGWRAAPCRDRPRALATAPKFILLDEPFAGVDPISVGDIKQIIRHLKAKGIGVLFTDHNVRETLTISARRPISSTIATHRRGYRRGSPRNELVKESLIGPRIPPLGKPAGNKALFATLAGFARFGGAVRVGRQGVISAAMKPSLVLKMGQQLTMTPQLQQAIRLLSALDARPAAGDPGSPGIQSDAGTPGRR